MLVTLNLAVIVTTIPTYFGILFFGVVPTPEHLSYLVGFGVPLLALVWFRFCQENIEEKFKLIITTEIYMSLFSILMLAFFSKGLFISGFIWILIMPMILMLFVNAFSGIVATIVILLSIFVLYLKFYTIENFSLNLTSHDMFLYSFDMFSFVVFLGVIGYYYSKLSNFLISEVNNHRQQLIQSAKFFSLGEMASNLAHDINGPLFLIQGRIHQIHQQLSSGQADLKKCDELVEGVENSITKLTKIVKGISTFAREGKGDNMIYTSLSEIVEDSLSFCMSRIESSQIKLEKNLESEISLICHPSFVSQIILNLINNAIDALENVEDKRIQLTTYETQDEIILKISDSGPGVPKHHLTRIFEPFFTTKQLGKGTGLGLSITQGLIQVHDGYIEYVREGQLTSFVVHFPSYRESLNDQ